VENDHKNNILIILFAILVFLGIGFIIFKDINSLQKHLEKCKQECYPGIVIEEFSRKKCLCQETE